MVNVALATEDELSEAVGRRLLAEANLLMAEPLLLRKNGFGYLRSNMRKWQTLALQRPVIVFTDLDKSSCPVALLNDWYGAQARHENLLLRIAVREVESWLLADHEAMRGLIGNKGRLPQSPDTLDDPKQHLLTLAKRAPRDIRMDLVKERGSVSSQGIGYNTRLIFMVENNWCPDRAAQHSPSLGKARLRLHELRERLVRR